MPTTLNSGLQLPDKGSVDWYSSMQTNYGLLDNHLENTDIHVTAEDKANWNSKQGSLSQAQLDAIAQVATNTSDIATLQSGKANASHTHSSSDIADIGDYATKQYVDNSISGLVDNAPDALNTLNELSAALNDDSNFASTVTTALGNKANSADLATVATSGSYTDLTDKPTINDSTITIQKNGSTVDTFTTNGSAKTINIPVPTKTSDITNDSNFVDTSNAAVASGITSAKVTDYDTHIVDTDIHVTFADKTSWNGKADDSSVVHNSGNEDVNGIKTFKDMISIDGDYLGNEASTNQRTNILLRSNRDTSGKSGIYITKFRQNRAQGELQPLDLQKIGFDVLENEVRTKNVFDIQCTDWLNDVPQRVNFVSSALSYSYGRSTNKALFNDLNPGALSLPDLNNGIDISGYITPGNSNNTYTPLVDGYVSVNIGIASGGCAVFLSQGDLYNACYSATGAPDVTGISAWCMLPVKGDVQINIGLKGGNNYINSAKFFPCLGNV